MSVSEDKQGLLRPKDVARMLGISYRAVYDLIENRKLIAIEKRSLTGNRRFWYIPFSEVEKIRRERSFDGRKGCGG